MQPMNFPESNGALNPPANSTDVEPVFVWRGEVDGHREVITKWKLTAEELAEINRTGEVYLRVRGATMPPVAIVVANPFVPPVEAC